MIIATLATVPARADLARRPAGQKNSVARTEPAVKLRGQVLPYREAVGRKTGQALVEEWGRDLLAFQTEEGRILPLLPTEAARFFYQDRRMWRRRMEVTSRVDPNVPAVSMLEVRAVKGDRLYEIFYWCDICSIKMYQLKQCECCQGPVQIREHPVGEPLNLTITK